MSFRFKSKAPVLIKVVFALLCVNALGQLATSFAIPRWSPIAPDAAHPYMVHFKGLAGYFVQPWLGMYFDYGYWTHLILLALFFVTLWVYRDQIERTH
ncbi:MAG: hypothetical protein WA485_10545 [Candidatus Sulfotelmatobacter sp.]